MFGWSKALSISISLLNLSGFFTLLFGITLTARYYFVPFNEAFTTLPYVPDPITYKFYIISTFLRFMS